MKKYLMENVILNNLLEKAIKLLHKNSFTHFFSFVMFEGVNKLQVVNPTIIIS